MYVRAYGSGSIAAYYYASTGTGCYGVCENGTAGVYALSTGTGSALYVNRNVTAGANPVAVMANVDSSNVNSVLEINQAGAAAGVDIIVSGTGPALQCGGQVIRLEGLKVGTSTKTASDATIDDTEEVIFCNATSGNQTHDLPAVSGNDGLQYTFIKTDSSSYTVTIDANSTETIAGELTQVLSIQYSSLTIVCNGTEWFIR